MYRGLEHCSDPNKAVQEIYRVLRKGGKLILTTRFVFPIHEAPNDYYRFTRYGLEKLFNNFSECNVTEDSTPIETLAIISQRLAYQCDFVININFILHLLSKVILRLNFIISKQYGAYHRKNKINNFMSSGYYVTAIK